MFQVDRQTLGAIRRFGLLLVAVGWVVFALLGRESQVFLVAMIVATMIVGAGVSIVFRRRDAG